MAIRSNSKAAKAAIREFIVDYLRNGTDYPEELSDNELAALHVSNCDEWLGHDYWLKTTWDRVSHDLDCGGWECGTYERRKLIKGWLQQTDEQAGKYSPDKVDEMFHYLVTREIMAMAGEQK